MTEQSPSVLRVENAAQTLGLDIDIIHFEEPAKTAQAAAELIGCHVGQIANSLIFKGKESGELKLLLTSGAHRVDLDYVAQQIGEALIRATPQEVREQSGFAIGGVAPIGHLTPVPTFFDRDLMQYQTIWAAGGRAETVFAIAPDALLAATKAQLFDATH